MKAVISGATKGIGKAIAERFAAENIHLFLLARTSEDLKALREDLTKSGTQVRTQAVDLAKTEQIKALDFDDDTTILVNNLGLYDTDQAENLSLDFLQKQLETNLYSAIELSNRLLPTLKKNKGIVINIGSVMSLQADNRASSYSISKHAFKGWNDALREELRDQNVRVSAIYPAAVNTSSWDGIDADRTAMIQAEDIAEMAATLLKMKPNTLVEEIRISPRNFV